jgi:hypothetical protein
MRVIGITIVILGLVSLIFGIIYVIQASTAENGIAESIAPLPLDQLDAQYDTVKTQYEQMNAAGAKPGIDYNYLTIQKTGLGLARSNVGTAQSLRMNGIIDIILGLGLGLTGLAVMKKG